MSRKRLGPLAAVLCALISGTADAQEFRVYTRLMDVGGRKAESAARPPRIVARTLSLFHAGKVYDYLDPSGEVVIFDPGRRQFTILNTACEVAADIHFEQVRHLLNVARFETEQHLSLASGNGNSPSAAALRFQLQPEFEETWDAATNRLSLASPHVSYDVQCQPVDVSEAIDKYLRYADWTARLNYVLYHQALYPEPRLALNASLRRRQLMPVLVELQTSGEDGLHLRAEHRIHWNLDAKDRDLIHRWETMLRNKHTQRITFNKYQHLPLAGATGKGRS